MGGRGTKGHLLRGERSCRKCKQETRQQILQLPFPENGVRTVRSQRLPLCFAAITPLSLSPFAAALPLAHMQVQVLEAGKSKVKALADSASGEGLPPGAETAVFPRCPHMAEPEHGVGPWSPRDFITPVDSTTTPLSPKYTGALPNWVTTEPELPELSWGTR
uniref:uncharacterized protein LOC132692509 isoform X3 n=1 Tax=Panthera onca TaxID=9690 RepID=UPI0029554283|nr:uncharacterized protein LOC132692509 isoform X3 [Panthera onca]